MYITKESLGDFMHLQVPRKIWNMYINKELNNLAFQIYVEFFDRIKLSAYNNWIDQEGRVYIKYSYEELMSILKVGSRGTVSKGIKCLLEKNLILQQKGFNTSSKFYLSNILESSKNISSTQMETQKYTNNNISSTQMETQKYTFVDANNNNYNHNKINNKEEERKENISSSSFENLIIKGLKELNIKPTKTSINSIKKYTDEEFKATVKHMLVNNKSGIKTLLAILRDKDYLETRNNQANDTKINRTKKIEIMKQKLGDRYFAILNHFDSKYQIQGYLPDFCEIQSIIDTENYLISGYNKLSERGEI